MAAASASSRKRLGELALEKGLISTAQLHDALHTQVELIKLGLSERIGTILFKKNALSRQALDELLKEQTGNLDAAKPPAVRRLGNFELGEKVGQGAMGMVFRAHQITMDRTVALKILAPKYADDEAFIKRFVREARAAGQFCHENIVTALDVGFIAPYHYLVMEFVEGKTLRKIIKERGPLPEREALEIAVQIAKGLDHALTKKILHRDVKPENVMVTPQGVAKLLDMGLACVTGVEEEETAEDEQKNRQAFGTPHYISPEAARGADLDTRADIYSLGCTLYHMLAGLTPYQGPNGRAVMAMHIAEPFPEIREKRPKLSLHAARILERMTAKDRELRYANPEQVIQDLLAVLHGSAPKHAAAAVNGKDAKEQGGLTTGPRAPIGGRGTTGPRSPIRPRDRTTGPASPILGDRTGALAPTLPAATAARAKAAKASSILWLGGAGAALVLLGLGIALRGGGEQPAARSPAPKLETPAAASQASEPVKKVEFKAPAGPSRDQLAREALDTALQLRKEKPEAFAQLLPALAHAAEQAQETPVAKLGLRRC